MSSYNPNVPLANNSPSQDQPVMLLNSQTWNSTWEQDHQPYGSSANAGFSNQLTLILQAAAVAANATGGRLFCQNDGNGVAQLYWRAPATNGGGIQQITSAISGGGGGSSPPSSTGSYSTSITFGTSAGQSIVFTVQQWFWVLSGGLQIKLISFYSPSPPAIPYTVGTVFTFLGTGGTAAPFALQPIWAAVQPPNSTVSIFSPPSVFGLPCYATTLPSTFAAGAYTTGCYVNPMTWNAANQTASVLIVGI